MINTKLRDQISQAKAKLLVDYPYFGTLASKIQLSINDDIESFKSDGIKIEFREEYFACLDLSEMEFILANGAMHASLAHTMRKEKRSGWLWQMATDMAINDMLVENGLDMPYGAHYRKRFSGMYAEEIYAELKADMLRDGEDLEYEADDEADIESDKKEDEVKQQTQELLEEEILQKQLFAQAALDLLEKEFFKGEMPKSIERFFTLLDESKVDWKEELRHAIEQYFLDDYRILPPSKKLLYTGVYLPSSVSQTFRLVIAVDSSASIDTTLFNQFLSEVNALMSLISHYEIELIVCDEKIHFHQTFYSGDTLEVKLRGGGGTDFRPVFRYIEEYLKDVKLLLYFSDLEGIFPKEEPLYEVKWVVSKVKEVPFGTFILL